MKAVKTVLKIIMTVSFLCLISIEPGLAAGDSNKPTQSPSNEKPKKEDNSKPTPAATEVAPSTAVKPVESKPDENKPSAEAKPSKEAKPTDEAKPSKEAKPDSQVKKPEKTANEKKVVKSEVKVNGKSDTKSDPKAKNSNSNSDKNESKKSDKGLGNEKKAEKVESSSPTPIPEASKSSSTVITSDDPAQSSTTEVLPKSFVRIEKSNGNRATLIVSGQKIGSIIKITITSKGPTK